MKPLAVYVHIPFCTVKCGYCDFNAYAGLHDLAPAYCDALERDIDSWAGAFAGRELASVFFGGGTPSEVPAGHIARVLARLARHSTFATDAEVSLEANPGTLTGDYLSALRAAGVGRLSIGAQSFHDSELRFLDRIHSAAASAATVRLAREAGFSNVSLDLIYGLPGASLERWLDSLGQAMALRPEHLSCYALTVEEGTPLALRVLRGELAMPDGDLLAEMYEHASEALLGAGYVQYEISNWARPGYECRHNRVYWTWGDYVPIGAGAHGFMGGRRYENVAHPREYIEATARGGERAGLANEYQPDLVTSIGDWLATR
ncbi:MAG: radical SAM family heme chaperone HemW, partial [Dehalococcoidia bacterium]